MKSFIWAWACWLCTFQHAGPHPSELGSAGTSRHTDQKLPCPPEEIMDSWLSKEHLSKIYTWLHKCVLIRVFSLICWNLLAHMSEVTFSQVVPHWKESHTASCFTFLHVVESWHNNSCCWHICTIFVTVCISIMTFFYDTKWPTMVEVSLNPNTINRWLFSHVLTHLVLL